MAAISTVSTYDRFVVGSNTFNEQQFTHAWWYNVLFIYNAATVLIAARLCGDVIADIGEDELGASWSLATSMLERYAKGSTWVHYLLEGMRNLATAAGVRLADESQAIMPHAGMESGQGQNEGNSFVHEQSQLDGGIFSILENSTELYMDFFPYF